MTKPSHDSPVVKPRLAWLCGALIAGCVLGLPVGWLLAYLAMLPMFLGLFFYLLFGLLIGAVMVRWGRPAAPAPKMVLWLIGVFVAVLVGGTSLAVEYRELPQSVYEKVRKSFVRSFTPQELATLHARTTSHVSSHLEMKYPPGGFIGYLQWAAREGTMDCPRVFSDSMETFKLPQRRMAWLVRLSLGLLFLLWTILVQVLELARTARGTGGESTCHTDSACTK